MTSEAERRVIEASVTARQTTWPGKVEDFHFADAVAWAKAVDALLAERARPTPPAPAVEIAELERKVAEIEARMVETTRRMIKSYGGEHGKALRELRDELIPLHDEATEALAAARRPPGPELLSAEGAQMIWNLSHVPDGNYVGMQKVLEADREYIATLVTSIIRRLFVENGCMDERAKTLIAEIDRALTPASR